MRPTQTFSQRAYVISRDNYLEEIQELLVNPAVNIGACDVVAVGTHGKVVTAGEAVIVADGRGRRTGVLPAAGRLYKHSDFRPASA